MNTGSYFIYTFGCAMNEYDSERIASALEKHGLFLTNEPSQADVILFNTCSVREKPQKKIASYLGVIRKFKRATPPMIGICGCVAQQEGQNLLKQFSDVQFVMGTEALSRIDTTLERAFRGERFADTDMSSDTFTVGDFNRAASVSASVTIMRGCENFCSYCIVPYVRGKEISRSSIEIVGEVQRLVDNGVKEVTLLGQNVNSYGYNSAEEIDFSELLKKVDKIDGIKRIRFITSHPKDFSEKLIHTIADSEKICRYVHLPMQSGSDRVLELMNRGYTYAEYMNKIDYARKIMPDVGFSSDFIIGFPTETEQDFEETIKAIRYVNFDHIFAFKYSPRPLTKSWDMKDDVSEADKSRRLAALFDVKDEVTDKKLSTLIGTTTDVLVTGRSKKDANVYTGCNVYQRSVNFTSDIEIATGEEVTVRIEEAKRNSLFGKKEG